MLPPIDSSILQNNPKFASLYTTLQTQILNPNGSTKHHPSQQERDAVSEALKAARHRAAKSHLLIYALTTLDISTNPSPSTSTKRDSKARSEPQAQSQTTATPPPTDLAEPLILLTSLLTQPNLPDPSKAVLESTPQYAALSTHIPALSGLLSAHLHAQALALARIANTTTNASYLHRQIPKLPSQIRDLQDGVAEKREELERRRMDLVAHATTLLDLYHLASALVIRMLEGSKHGVVARHVKAKTEYLSLVAQTVELESREKGLRAERMVYSEEVREALGNYMRELRDGRERLRERRKHAERVLWGYGVGREGGEKERVMKEIARVYGELQRELVEVNKDIERLKGK